MQKRFELIPQNAELGMSNVDRPHFVHIVLVLEVWFPLAWNPSKLTSNNDKYCIRVKKIYHILNDNCFFHHIYMRVNNTHTLDFKHIGEPCTCASCQRSKPSEYDCRFVRPPAIHFVQTWILGGFRAGWAGERLFSFHFFVLFYVLLPAWLIGRATTLG